MKTTYYNLWLRAQKHLDEDLVDAHVYANCNQYNTEEVDACILSGMFNAYLAVKYIVQDALVKSSCMFSENDRLSDLLDKLILTGDYNITKAGLKWAYDTEKWETSGVLVHATGQSMVACTEEYLKDVDSKIFALRCNLCGYEE